MRFVRAIQTFGLALAGACSAKAPCAYVEPARSAVAPLTCAALACPLGSRPSATGRCACDSGLFPLLGGCVSQDVGAGVCAPAARFRAGACDVRACAAEQAIDLETGACLPQASVDAASRVHLEPGEHARCHDPAATLAVSGSAYCVPGLAQALGAEMRCAAGEVLDEIDGRCVRIVRPDRTSYRVDVANWARVVLGTDGGRGSQRLCNALQLAGGDAAYAARVEVAVELVMPDNDVASAAVSVTPTFGNNPRGLAVTRVRGAVARLVEPLRSIGGSAEATAVSLHFACDLPSIASAEAAGAQLPDGGGAAGL